jgi:hypothetical protein
MKSPIIIRIAIVRPDGRGWVGVACFALVLITLAMMWFDRTLLRDDFFKTISTALIITAWLNGPVGWAYQSTKAGNEASASSARIAEQAASAAIPSNGGLGPWATSLIAEIAAIKTATALDALEAEHLPNIDAAPPTVAKALREAFEARRKALETPPPPKDAIDAANQVAGAATDAADKITENTTGEKP